MSTDQIPVADELYADMLPDFLDEAHENLDRLNKHLLELDEQAKAAGGNRFDHEVLNEMFRAAHTLKGLSGMLGLENINALTHKVENVFDAARSNELQITTDVVEVVFLSIDRLGEMLARLKEGQDDAIDCVSVLDHIATLLERSGVERPATSQLDVERAMHSTRDVASEAVQEPGPADIFADIHDDVDLTSKYISVFVDEAEQTLDELTEALLAGADENVTEKVLVLCHRMKGSAAAIGLRRAAKLAHYMEDQLQFLHDQSAELSVEMTDAMLDCAEALRVFVGSLKHGQLQTEHFLGVHHNLIRSQATINGPAVAAIQPVIHEQPRPHYNATSRDTMSVEQSRSRPAAHGSTEPAGSAAKPTETIRVDIDRLDQLMNLAGQLVINKACFTQICDGLRQLTTGKRIDDSVGNIFGSLKRLNDEIDGFGQGRDSAASVADLRRQVRRIQSEMEAVQRRMGHWHDIRRSVNQLLEAVHQLDRVSHGMQQCVMDTRMVPIGPLLARFKRVIRDISRSKGKEIRLEIRGEKTELDKRMVDELGDPLIHIVRNAADHGIEMPDDRAAAGKPREGTVILDAFHRGNSIMLQISDDGKGLDARKIRDTAVRKGLLSPADAEQLTDHQVYQLIWQPGLSTADHVTEVSGRGMGMDIVRSKVEDIHGTIELDSQPGRGTTIKIKLPLTLAILPSLLAEIDGDVFAIPVETVSEIVRVAAKDVFQVHGLNTATVRGRVISLLQLNELFAWHHGRGQRTAEKCSNDQTMVIIGTNGQEIGLSVDRLLGEADVVTKSLAENYRNVEGIAGASVLGDGRVSLILDVGALVERAARAKTPIGSA